MWRKSADWLCRALEGTQSASPQLPGRHGRLMGYRIERKRKQIPPGKMHRDSLSIVVKGYARNEKAKGGLCLFQWSTADEGRACRI
jgi:hypothetical protein